jgi:NADPH:quinone reductase-like Zn-dependent oxidoreductase
MESSVSNTFADAEVRRSPMKAIVRAEDSPDKVEVRELDKPALADHQVLVRVYASSVNPADWYGVMRPFFARIGERLSRSKSQGVGSDLAGTIEAVGKDVAEFQPGDEVFGTAGGSWAEYAAAREVRLVRKPASVSFEEAAAVPVAAITALQALRDKGHVQPGQKALINGASGGVGTYAVQLAKFFGADVTAVCSTRNVEQARALGADRVIDYTKEDFTQRPERHELMLDIAGSRPFSQARRVLTRDATLVVVGAKMSTKGLGPLKHIARMKLGSTGRSQKVLFFVAKIEKDDLAFLAEQLESGKLKSVIDRRFALSQVPDALRYLGEGHARGKIVITVRGG